VKTDVAFNNLGTAVAEVSHTGSSTPPVSVAHVTASNDNVNPAPTSTIEIMDQQQNVTQDMLAFPDNTSLAPGGNLMIALFSSPGKTNYLSLNMNIFITGMERTGHLEGFLS
jgi:hypothetical protein